MTVRTQLQRVYKILVQAGYHSIFDSRGDCAPESFKRSAVNLMGFERQYFIRRLVDDAQRVLVVGDWWGVDTWSLKLAGKDVYALDIAPQIGINRLVLGDVTKELPYSDKTFDAVVIAEVLEHLIEDHTALINLRRVLKDDGVLVVTVPFLHDEPEVHVRVHTPATIRRLLDACGFEVKTTVIRAGLASLDGSLFTLGHHSLNLLSYFITKKTLYQFYLPRIADVDWFLGQRAGTWMRFSKSYGCYICAGKTAPKNFRALNVDEFSTHIKAS